MVLNIFSHWNTFIDKISNDKNIKTDYNLPFSGKSSYMDTYGNIENKYNKTKKRLILS